MSVNSNGLVSTRDEFEFIRSNISSVFYIDRRFPDLVFKNALPRTLFCEYEAALAPELWPMFQKLARLHGDSKINLLVVEPGYQPCHLDRYGMYPAISLSVNSSPADYWDIIGSEDRGSIDSLADVIAITGTSGAWGCWGERSDEVLAVQGVPESISDDEWCDEFGPFLRSSEALDSYISFAFRDGIPEWYASTFTQNYHSR